MVAVSFGAAFRETLEGSGNPQDEFEKLEFEEAYWPELYTTRGPEDDEIYQPFIGPWDYETDLPELHETQGPEDNEVYQPFPGPCFP
ncbi:Coordinator of PRMT5 and differentiation stimulator [Caenorhabditis elegans]|uniref:Coordinator of PRMT5 and differentiation stimulator n=1 Tax=Caenorhabditis elegans TaxID=6239 RepID=Q9XVH0_CAEEL|nr:Coordinator of PRMT5 and differentiation stimulator [Caenorhabditis elegans]CAB03463.1 Coordinator of PRMT5 and differentiation stimulator [Caenorhabditis elegans]|eukprot:NP_493184.1 Uncharacterized protein CELE_W02D9.6 [Caenorhabditis elegans]